MRTGIGKRGSSTVILAMIFVAFAICITSSITIARKMTVSSECEAFGRLWARAVLSEYDRHLLEDYGIMAYFGDENMVSGTVDKYIEYSAAGKMNAYFSGTVAEMTGYELGDPANFEKALRQSFAGSAAESFIRGTARHARPEAVTESDNRTIGNQVVLDTLPSAGIGSTSDAVSVADKLKSAGTSEGIQSVIAGSGIEMAFIWHKFGNNVTVPDDSNSYFRNEWEYILSGRTNDEQNNSLCRKKLFAVRNALDLAALYKDPEKVELISAAAELITPGPLAAATQLLLAEAWAAMEAEADIRSLYENERVPVLKKGDEWQISLEGVLSSDAVRKKLEDASEEMTEENREALGELTEHTSAAKIVTDGLSYDEHLMFMILMLRKETRLLRVMDLVQINMKYRYYRDFDLMEYFTGVRFTIKANGKDHCFEDSYK